MQGELFCARTHISPSRANFFTQKLLTAWRDETVNTNARTSARLRETRDAFAHHDSAENGCFCLAMVPSVSPETERAPAKVLTVSRESPAAPVSDTTSALTQKSHIISLGHFLRTSQHVAIPTIRIHSLKYPQGNYVRNCWDQATHQQPSATVWRALSGLVSLAATPVGDSSLLWREPEGPEGLAAVPVGGGGAWPGFETTRRAKLAARTASGRAAAHGHTKQPGSRAGRRPRAHRAARPSRQPTTTRTRRPRRAARAGTGRGSG